jgi:hypothetical protein
MWGNLTWGDAHYLIRNIIKNDKDEYVGDIQIETGNTYVKKDGTERKEYKKVGALRFNKDSGVLVLDENGKITKQPFTPTPQTNDRGNYLLLSFGEENPYLKYLDTDEEPTVEDAVSDNIPF